MPKLKGNAIPPGVGRTVERLGVRDDEIVVGCPLLKPCGWETVRPLSAAHSAQVAHRMRHARGIE